MGPQVGFQVKEEVRMGLGFDCAFVEARGVVKRRRSVWRNDCAAREKGRIWCSWWDEGSDIHQMCIKECTILARGSIRNERTTCPVKDCKCAATSRQGKAGDARSLSGYHYYFIFRQTIILRSTPHAADWISEGSLHDHNIPVVGGNSQMCGTF